MTDSPMRSPLAGLSDDLARVAMLTRGAVAAVEVTDRSQLAVRADPALLGRLPLRCPTEPNTVAVDGDREVLWLGPDEWLVVTSEDATKLAAAIAAAAGTAPHAVVDVSANRAILELRGPGRHALLASHCPIDLHPGPWRDGACAQTVLGSAQVLIHERPDATRVFTRPSFGAYVVGLLVDAAASGAATSVTL